MGKLVQASTYTPVLQSCCECATARYQRLRRGGSDDALTRQYCPSRTAKHVSCKAKTALTSSTCRVLHLAAPATQSTLHGAF